MIRQTSWFSLGHRMYGRVILLRDLLLLLAASVSEKNMGGKLVEFIGHMKIYRTKLVQDHLRINRQVLVKYGTSVPLARAINPA